MCYASSLIGTPLINVHIHWQFTFMLFLWVFFNVSLPAILQYLLRITHSGMSWSPAAILEYLGSYCNPPLVTLVTWTSQTWSLNQNVLSLPWTILFYMHFDELHDENQTSFFYKSVNKNSPMFCSNSKRRAYIYFEKLLSNLLSLV